MSSNTFVCEDDFDCWPNGSCGTELRCLCEPGYTGKQCEEVCPLKCQNGGQCFVDNLHELIHESDAYCKCPSGYEGGLCDRVSGGAMPANDPTSQSSQNLSSPTGPISGIVVGVVLAASAVAIVATVFIRRRHHKTNSSFKSTEKSETASSGPEDKNLPSVA